MFPAPLILLVLSALVLTVPGLVLLKRAVVGLPRVKTRCRECRFDLSGCAVGTERCPECGAAVLARGQRPPLPRGRRLLFAGLGLLCLVPLMHSGPSLFARARLWLAPSQVAMQPMGPVGVSNTAAEEAQ